MRRQIRTYTRRHITDLEPSPAKNPVGPPFAHISLMTVAASTDSASCLYTHMCVFSCVYIRHSVLCVRVCVVI